jgi:hypothetical protein
VWPLIIACSTSNVALPLVGYDSHGARQDQGPYIGFPYQQVQNNGAFEVVVATEVYGRMADGNDAWCQLSHDPEIDNKKGGTR